MLGKKLSQNFAISIVSMVLGILSSIFIARIGGPAILGNISLAMSFQVLIKSVFTHTVNSAHLKMYSDDKEIGLKNFLFVNIFYNIVTTLLVLLFVLWNWQSDKGTFTDLQINLIVIFILQDYLLTPLYLYVTDQSSKLNILRANLVDFSSQILINIAKIVAVVIGGSETAIAWYMMAACGLSAIYPLIQLLQAKFGTFSFEIFKKYIRYSISISTSTIAYGFLLSFDKVLLGLYAVPAEAIGYYNVGNRLGILLMSIGVSVGGIFLSVFSQNIHEKNHEKTLDQLSNYERYISILFYPAVLFSVLFGREIISLVFGEIYVRAYPILILSLLFALVKTLNIPYQNYLFASNQFKIFNQGSIIFAVSIIVVSLLLVYLDFFNDLTISVALGLLISCLIERLVFVNGASKVDSRIKFMFHPRVLFVFGTLALVWLLAEQLFVGNSSLLSCGIRGSILLLALPIGFLTGIYTKADVQLVTGFVNNKLMKKTS
ncbi:lipopolysaccharide biosynthesis protein [Telluribacter sp.]|jgi:O-antigen/teichoic acid export membrane protein|uniref:lipopolysaccharide biosynthesis protein n=1 Tax=Telluribacter sp. TaxID=1978767 RepID=UPI002E10B225|nr:oligosaccharide flippase family protein [Telluribacter sp.]